MAKLFYFDIESTGVKYWRNGIHQIGGIIEIDGVEKERFDIKVKPIPTCDIEQEALDVGKVTMEQIMAYPPMEEVYRDFVRMLGKYVNKYDKTDKFYLVGYNNASFDNQFLRAWFVQNGDNYFGSWFWANCMDVFVMATPHLMKRRTMMKDFKLMTVARELGLTIDEEKLHDAMYDIEVTRKCFKILTGGEI